MFLHHLPTPLSPVHVQVVLTVRKAARTFFTQMPVSVIAVPHQQSFENVFAASLQLIGLNPPRMKLFSLSAHTSLSHSG